MSARRDKHTVRGIIYCIVSICGIGYELLFRKSPEVIVILLYFAVLGIGTISIFFLKDPTSTNS
ncbi:MAG: hypothetical protein V3U73_01850 [bacterium]